MNALRHLFVALVTALLASLSFAAAAAVDANQAVQADLESIKGVGPALAGKILAERQQARFKDWSDMIDRVSGLGPGNAVKLSQNGLTVDGRAFQASADAPAPKAKAAKMKDAATDASKEPAKDGKAVAKAAGQ